MRRMMARPRVVLPQPLSPTSPTVSPAATVRLTSSTALTYARTRLNRPCFTGKWTLRFLTSSRFTRADQSGVIRVQGFLRSRQRSIPVKTTPPMIRLHFQKLRHFLRAVTPRFGAARMKAATCRKCAEIRNAARNRNQTVCTALKFRHRVEERLGIRMERVGQQLGRLGKFDDLPGVHHNDAISNVADDAEIVCDQQDTHSQFLLELAQQFDDLRLDCYIKSGGRFVGDQQLRPGCQGHRDHDPLLHAAGQLVWVIANSRFGCRNADQFEQANDFVVGRTVGPVQFERFLDLIANPENWIKRAAWLLEDITHDSTTKLAQLGFIHAKDVLPIEQNLASDVTRGRRG